MPYRELRPAPELRALVDCYWILDPSPAQPISAHRVLPDGCIDVLIEVSGRVDVSVVGAMTRAIVAPAGHGTLVGVRFRPGQAARILRVPAADLRDQRVGLDGIWSRGVDELAHRVATVSSDGDRARALDEMLRRRMLSASPVDRRVTHAIAGLHRGDRVADVARTASLGERQIHRLFLEHVGIAPKVFARVMRLLRAVRHLDLGAPLADVAYAAGYVDQAHFTREARELAGTSPTRLRLERRGEPICDS